MYYVELSFFIRDHISHTFLFHVLFRTFRSKRSKTFQLHVTHATPRHAARKMTRKMSSTTPPAQPGRTFSFP